MANWPPHDDEARVLRIRFWKYVNVATPDECWLWDGARTKGGYGILTLTRNHVRRSFTCHRLSLLFAGHVFDREQLVLHSCDNPPCCNPSHLRVGTPLENAQDRSARQRHTWARGERSGSAVLDTQRVREIRAALAAGQFQVDIARRFGVAQTTVSAVKRREIWAHV